MKYIGRLNGTMDKPKYVPTIINVLDGVVYVKKYLSSMSCVVKNLRYFNKNLDQSLNLLEKTCHNSFSTEKIIMCHNDIKKAIESIPDIKKVPNKDSYLYFAERAFVSGPNDTITRFPYKFSVKVEIYKLKEVLEKFKLLKNYLHNMDCLLEESIKSGLQINSHYIYEIKWAVQSLDIEVIAYCHNYITNMITLQAI